MEPRYVGHFSVVLHPQQLPISGLALRQAEQNAAWKVLEKLKLIKVVPPAAVGRGVRLEKLKVDTKS